MRGLRKSWEKGPRTFVSGMDRGGKSVLRTGKRGGPVVEQLVVLVLSPKGQA